MSPPTIGTEPDGIGDKTPEQPPPSASQSKASAEVAAMMEVEKRIQSQAWRIQNLYWVEDEHGRKVKFRPRAEQKELHNNLHTLHLVLKCRQPGISTYCALLELDFCLFTSHKTCGIIDKTDPDAVRKLEKIKFAYDHLNDPDDPETARLGQLVKDALPMVARNDHECEWLNGSKIWAGTKMRGGTLQLLWITEFGYTSFYDPKDAQEIQKGAFNTVHKGQRIIVESTHEGGKFGIFYGLCKLGMETREPAGPMDWRVTFFPWHMNVSYTLDPPDWFRLSTDDQKYFEGLHARGIKLTAGQMHWYVKKRDSIGQAFMFKEYPSLPEECFEGVISGAIYGKLMTSLRMNKRIVDFEHDRQRPFYTFWDIGYSDFTAIWLVQMVGRDLLAQDFICSCREPPEYYVARIREWERKYEKPVDMHYLPHDADAKEKSGKSYRDYLSEAGLPHETTRVVVVTPDEWLGINHLRSLLPRFYFHKSNCGREWQHEGRTMPSGIGCLEGYHTKEDASSGIIRENPVHDDNSHGAAALRTFAEAHLRGLLEGTSAVREAYGIGGKPRTILAGYGNRTQEQHRGFPQDRIWPGPQRAQT